jgi:hypothetical protein
MDRSSRRCSPMKAGGDAVRAETGAVRCGRTPLGHRGVDGASRGRKWRRRHGAPVLARGKWANEGRCRATPFYGGSTAFGEEKGRGVWLGARPSEGGGGGVRSAWRAHERWSRPVEAGSGANVMEAGNSRAACSCRSRGWGGTDKWAGPEGGAQQHRERRRRGRVTGGTTGFK